MRMATSNEMMDSLRGIPTDVRFQLVKNRTNPATSGTDRSYFRSQVPQNPLRILDIAINSLKEKGWRNPDFRITSRDISMIGEGENEVIVHQIDSEIVRSEAEWIACLNVLKSSLSWNG